MSDKLRNKYLYSTVTYVLIPRYQQAYGQSYTYSGGVSYSIPHTPLVANIQERLNELLNINETPGEFNMCLCNWYEPHHYIGPHSDDTRQLIIASLSWGSPRTFVLKPKSKTLEKILGACSKEILLNSGDLVIMGGRLPRNP